MNSQQLGLPAATTIHTVHKEAEGVEESDDGVLQNAVFWT